MVDRAAMERVARLLVLARRPVDPADMLDESSLSRTKLAAALHRLEEEGFVETRDDGSVRAVGGEEELDDAVEHAAEREEHRHSFDRSRVEMMRAYADRRGCRRAFILGYFGEGYDPPCGNCDNCDAGLSEAEDEAAGGLAVGARVAHDEWGVGTIGQLENGQITVVFDEVGYKTLDAGLVAERGLLSVIS
jgi:ATP-dependent DNA helicase RecQ